MTKGPPPFTPRPFGRLTPVEESSCLDASELAWSGALDGTFNFSAWPWAELAERELDLFERGWLSTLSFLEGMTPHGRSWILRTPNVLKVLTLKV